MKKNKSIDALRKMYQDVPVSTYYTVSDLLEEFRAKLEKFLRLSSSDMPAIFTPVVSLEIGKKYARIVKSEVGTQSRCAYGFIDLATGDIYMPDGWKRPAKHSRGNICQPDDELFGAGKVCGPYGVARLR